MCSQIENQNNIKGNVVGYENKQPFPFYISKAKCNEHFNLLLITEAEKKHYVLITDFNKFMYNQTKHKEIRKLFLHVLFTMFQFRECS